MPYKNLSVHYEYLKNYRQIHKDIYKVRQQQYNQKYLAKKKLYLLILREQSNYINLLG